MCNIEIVEVFCVPWCFALCYVYLFSRAMHAQLRQRGVLIPAQTVSRQAQGRVVSP